MVIKNNKDIIVMFIRLCLDCFSFKFLNFKVYSSNLTIENLEAFNVIIILNFWHK